MSRTDAVFAYGTLQIDAVMHAVTGRRFDGAEALLPGFRRRRLMQRTYPGIVPFTGEETRGVVVRGVDAETLARLDAFEDELYDRRVLEVRTGGGGVLAWTYVVADPYRHLLSDQPWDVQDFLLEHGEAFLASCRRFAARSCAKR